MEDEDKNSLDVHLKPILARHLDYIDEMHTVLGLSIQGIEGLKLLLPGLAKSYECGDMEPNISEDRMNEIRTNMAARTTLASAEIERGFPVLYSHATVALWGAVEDFSNDLAVGLLKYEPDLLTHKVLSKVRVPLTLFNRMSEDERLTFLVGELKQSLSGAADGGIGQYNEVFSQLGLDGSLHKSIQDPLIELCQVRNVLVHRGGIVDTQLINRCPWFATQKGSKFLVLKPSYETYWLATHRYWLNLANRVRVRVGLESTADPMEQEGVLPN